MGSFMRKALVMLKKNAPKILFGVGIVGSIGATVLAIKKGHEVNDIIEEDLKELEELKGIEEPGEETVKELRAVKRRVIFKGMKHFMWVAIIELASCAAMTWSFVTVFVQLKRATAALIALNAFVKVGENGDTVDPETGEITERELTQADLDALEAKKLGFGPCAIRLTDKWSDWTERRAHLVTELCHLEEVMQNKFEARPEFGLYCSTIFDEMHIDLRPEFGEINKRQLKLARTYGWLKGNGDEYIDLGLREFDENDNLVLTLAAQKFVDGEVDYLWINPNVDGPIIDKI